MTNLSTDLREILMKRIERCLWGFVGVAGILSGFSSCSSEAAPGEERPVPNKRVDIELSARTRAVADNLRDYYVGFTTDAVRYVDNHPEEKKNPNVIVSPLSASILLGMVANGVEEEAMETICRYLGTDDLDGLNTLASQLLTELPAVDNETKLSLANAIWVNDKFHLSSAFTSAMAATYDPAIEYGDFVNNGAGVKDDIFKWCEKETNGLIRQLDLEIHPQTMAVLLNAMYFKGMWNRNPFDSKNTRKADFHGAGGTKSVDMMDSGEIKAEYGWTKGFTAFRLYFGNGAYSYTVLLPGEGMTAEGSLAALTPEVMKEIETMSPGTVILQMPKMKVERELSLSDVFEGTDMEVLNRSAHFTMFEPKQPGEMTIKQSATFSVDETGAEGAAVTFANFDYAAGPDYKPTVQTITVDRPFFFFINEVSTGACILSGRVAEV